MKTRKITIKAKACDKSKILEKYDVSNGKKISSNKEITFDVEIEDSSEVLKKLSSDAEVLDWYDFTGEEEDQCEIPGNLEKVATVDLLQDQIKKALYSVDLTDMKTVINMCLEIKESHEFYKNITNIPGFLLKIFQASYKWNHKLPAFSEQTIKNILKDMSDGKKEFGKKLYNSLTQVLSMEYPMVTDEAYLKLIFVDYYGKE